VNDADGYVTLLPNKAIEVNKPFSGAVAGYGTVPAGKLTYLVQDVAPTPPTAVAPPAPSLEQMTSTRTYTATDGTQLSCTPGDVFEVINKSNADWIYAKNTASGKKGYVPGAILTPTNSTGAVDSPAARAAGDGAAAGAPAKGEWDQQTIEPVFAKCLTYLTHPQSLKEEGLFRVSGNKTKMLQLSAAFKKGENPDLGLEPADICALIKHELKERKIPFKDGESATLLSAFAPETDSKMVSS
jgi:hypothetical protein